MLVDPEMPPIARAAVLAARPECAAHVPVERIQALMAEAPPALRIGLFVALATAHGAAASGTDR